MPKKYFSLTKTMPNRKLENKAPIPSIKNNFFGCELKYSTNFIIIKEC